MKRKMLINKKRFDKLKKVAKIQNLGNKYTLIKIYTTYGAVNRC